MFRMWKRFHRTLHCPTCESDLELTLFESFACTLEKQYLSYAHEARLLDDDFDKYVNQGVLLCRPCNVYYPIFNGLPVLLSYSTAVHRRFAEQFKDQLQSAGLGSFELPSGEPTNGEHFVLNS